MNPTDPLHSAKLLEGPDSTLVFIETDSKRFIRKTYNEHVDGRKLVQQELSVLLSHDDIDGFLKPSVTGEREVTDFLDFEFFDGTPLVRFLEQESKLEIGATLKFARSVANILVLCHNRDITLRSLNPYHVFVGNSANLQDSKVSPGIAVRISGLGYALTPDVAEYSDDVTSIDAFLPWISPEQTGRVDAPLDRRSDLYSLGLLLYRMVTGVQPFSGADKAEIIHRQIALLPENPTHFRPDAPTYVSEIILRLLEKQPEDRYPSAEAFLVALEKVIRMYEAGNSGVRHSGYITQDRFVIPDTLFGREKEIGELSTIYDSCKDGGTMVVTIGGPPGIGKTALVEYTGKMHFAEEGFLVKGKFDQYDRSTPFQGFFGAMGQLAGKLLRMDSGALESWKKQLSKSLGSNATVLSSLVPEIEILLGPSEPIAEAGSAEERNNRLQKALQQFIMPFCRPGKPLVIFLDDLQWADEASFALLESLLRSVDYSHLLVLLSYRTDEIESSHSMVPFRKFLRGSGMAHEINLAPLDLASVCQFFSAVLLKEPPEVASLSEIIFKKTGGNAFYLKEFARRLYQDRLFAFDYESGAWTWDEKSILKTDVTHSAAQLLQSRIDELTEPEREILKGAACLGPEVQPTRLAKAFDFSAERVSLVLENSVQLGLMVPTHRPGEDTAFRFAHDLVREAVESTIQSEERGALHHRIIRFKTKSLGKEIQESRSFEMVNHYRQCLNLLEETEERSRFVQLSLTAAKKARSAVAWHQTTQYVDDAIKVVSDFPQAAKNGSLFELLLLAYEASAHSGDNERAAHFFNRAFSVAKTNIDHAKLQLVRARNAIAASDLPEVLDACRTGLRRLSINLPAKAGTLTVLLEFVRVQWMLRGKTLEDIYNLPLAKGEEDELISSLFYLSAHPAYVTSQELFGVFALKSLRASLNNGIGPHSILGLSAYGLFLAVGFAQYQKAYDIVKLGARISEKAGAEPHTHAPAQSFGNFYGEPLRDTFVHADRGNQGYDRSGLLREAAEMLPITCINRFHAGIKLPDIEKDTARFLAYIRKAGVAHLYDSVIPVYFHIKRLQGRTTSDILTMDERPFNETKWERMLYDTKYVTIAAYHHLLHMQSSFMSGDFENARKSLRRFLKVEHSVAGSFSFMEALFYRGAIIASDLAHLSGIKKYLAKRRLKGILSKFKNAAESSPANFEHRRMLLEGILSMSSGKVASAIELLDAARQRANEHQFIQNAAMASEWLARAFLNSGQKENARESIEQAILEYREWGAETIAQQVQDRWVSIMGPGLAESLRLNQRTERSSSTAVDMLSIYKASRAISQQITLKALMKQLIRILIENAGAENGVLLLEQDGELLVQAVGKMHPESLEVMQARPILESDPLPRRLVNYVSRSRKPVVLDDASKDPEYGEDAYIRRSRPRSVLCLPILNQSKLTGVLYLENMLTRGAFTPERLDVLDILASQSAVSIENALLYEGLENRVQIRTRELQHTLEDLRKTQEQLVQAEKMASLGQLAAGIAHEIKNPLNFVNNFSEINGELIDELAEETGQNGHIGELVNDLRRNNSAIAQHGMRADAIVRSLMDHAKGGSGERTETDLNPLVSEFVKLAYHNKRTQNAEVDISIRTDLDRELEQVNIIQQSIGRVVFNLIDNALDAVIERAEQEESGYEPSVHVSTRQLSDSVEVRVQDNGNGIPRELFDRIFEPFYTTKPTGTGTGLGLSLSYDIVQQGHGGTLSVESEPGIGTTFVMSLPIRHKTDSS